MKKIVIILVILFCGFAARSQVSVGYSVGYGKYDLKELKQIMPSQKEYYQNKYPELDFAIVDNFPGYVNHTLQVGYRHTFHEFGATGSFLTTGAKLSYADYSGEISIKLIANGYRVGAYYHFYLLEAARWKWDPVSLYVGISPAAIFSKVKSESFIRIAEETEHDTNLLRDDNLSFTLLPEIGVRVAVLSPLSIQLSVGYDVFLGYRSVDLADYRINWGGVRLGGGVVLFLKRKG